MTPKNYEAWAFVEGLKGRGIEPHIAINGTVSKHGKTRKTAVPSEVAASLRYAISQRLRKGLDKVRAAFVFAMAAYNIVRLPRLMIPRGEAPPAT
jgi:hypothetical protein